MTHVNNAFRSISRIRGAIVAAAIAVGAAFAGAAAVAAQDDPLEEARRQLLAGNYEAAIPAATRAIALFEPRAATEPEARVSLGAAYELRARARFGVADLPGATSDLEALLRQIPEHTLSPDLNPRFQRLFETARQAVTGEIALAVSPDGAAIAVDGVPLQGRAGPLRLSAGAHTITANRTGFKPGATTVQVPPGGKLDVTLTLEREFATVAFNTTPADVDVLIDGVPRGRTKAADATSTGAGISASFVLSDLKLGTYTLELRKPCYIPFRAPLPVTTLTDRSLEPIKLQPSVGTITFEGLPANAVVYIDHAARGSAATYSDVCAGDRTVEVRSPQGRFVQRLPVQAGQKYTIRPQIKPAFALLSSAGGEGIRRGDVRPRVEEQLQSAASLTLYVPPPGRAEELLKKLELPPDWLDFSRVKQPLGRAATIGADTRRGYGVELADQLEAQGIGAITILSAADPPEVRLSLLARGSSVPDVLEVKLVDPGSVLSTLERLNVSMPLHSAWAGFLAMDVLDGPAPGAVVARVTPGTQAATAGLEPGDVFLSANGQPTPDAAALTAAMDAALPAGKIAVELRSRAGAAKRADLTLIRAPRAITPDDQSILFNTLLGHLRQRLAAATSPEDQSVLRLNIGIALIALENWADALASFEGVRLGTGSGVAEGTLQYYRGLCFSRLGKFAEAQKAWIAARDSDAWLTEDGPPVKPLAEKLLTPARPGAK